jgi:hypothetical protein
MTRTQPGPKAVDLQTFKSNAFRTRAPSAAELRDPCPENASPFVGGVGEVSLARRLGGHINDL